MWRNIQVVTILVSEGNLQLTGEKQSSPSNDFMESNIAIKRDILIQERLSHQGDDVPAHGQQDDAKTERHPRRATT
jgi:hypothetical protein